MANLTKQQILGIINNAPEGTTPEGIIASLRKEGHTLEGYDQAQPIEKEQTPGVLGKIGRFIGVEKLGIGLGRSLFGLTKEKKELDRLLAEGKIDPKEYEQITTGGLTNKEVVGSAVQTAANFIPGAKISAGLIPKVATGAVTGYAFDVGGNLQQNKEGADILKPGLGTVVGGSLPLLAKITGLDRGVSRGLEKGATKLEKISERLTPVEKQNLAKKGQDISAYLAKKKVMGTPEMRYAKVNQLYDKMEDVVAKEIKESGVVFNKSKMIDSLKNIPEQFADDPAGYQEAVKKINSVVKFLKDKAPDKIPAELLNKYKRNIFKRAYSKNNTDVVNDTLHVVAEKMKEQLDNSIPKLQKINSEYGKIITARKILFKAQTRGQAGLFGKAGGLAAGTAIGGTFAGPGGAAVGSFVGPQIVEATATPLRTVVGAGMQSVSEIINKLPSDKNGNLQLTKKALMDLIQLIRS